MLDGFLFMLYEDCVDVGLYSTLRVWLIVFNVRNLD